jgi:NAD(P)-dependent dehydrogenase (short-subunit alcohol dehydrogenase family)
MAAPTFNFEGKNAIVTGGASGMGRRACELLAAAGAKVLVVDINEDAAAGVASGLVGATAAGADVTRPEAVERFVKQAAEHGGVDLFFNNAGVMGAYGPVAEATNEDYDRTFDVNVRGSFLCLSAVLRLMIDQKRGGAIVNTCSIAGLRGVANTALYSASKFAAIGVTRSAAKEAGAHGIRVNAICPGPTVTNFAQMSEEHVAQFISAVPLGRLGTVDDMALTALWLLSDGAAFLNGVIVPVDGGQTA